MINMGTCTRLRAAMILELGKDDAKILTRGRLLYRLRPDIQKNAQGDIDICKCTTTLSGQLMPSYAASSIAAPLWRGPSAQTFPST